jgi:hypothetical protein
MKWYKQHFGFSFALVILTAFVLQSVHSYEHLRKAFTEKQCHHVYQKNKTVVGHKHIELDHCFACEFTFSPNTATEIVSFEFYKPQVCVQKSVAIQAQIHNLFREGLFLLRAPPVVIA